MTTVFAVATVLLQRSAFRLKKSGSRNVWLASPQALPQSYQICRVLQLGWPLAVTDSVLKWKNRNYL